MLSSDKHSFRYVQIYNYYLYITLSKAKKIKFFSFFIYRPPVTIYELQVGADYTSM